VSPSPTLASVGTKRHRSSSGWHRRSDGRPRRPRPAASPFSATRAERRSWSDASPPRTAGHNDHRQPEQHHGQAAVLQPGEGCPGSHQHEEPADPSQQPVRHGRRRRCGSDGAHRQALGERVRRRSRRRRNVTAGRTAWRGVPIDLSRPDLRTDRRLDRCRRGSGSRRGRNARRRRRGRARLRWARAARRWGRGRARCRRRRAVGTRWRTAAGGWRNRVLCGGSRSQCRRRGGRRGTGGRCGCGCRDRRCRRQPHHGGCATQGAGELRHVGKGNPDRSRGRTDLHVAVDSTATDLLDELLRGQRPFRLRPRPSNVPLLHAGIIVREVAAASTDSVAAARTPLQSGARDPSPTVQRTRVSRTTTADQLRAGGPVAWESFD